jgi:hypothetical protein
MWRESRRTALSQQAPRRMGPCFRRDDDRSNHIATNCAAVARMSEATSGIHSPFRSRISRSLSSGAHSRDTLAHAGYLLRAACFRLGGASLSGSLGANAALPDASPPPELWAASSTAKAAEILIAKFRRPLRGDYRTLEQGPAGPFGGRDRIPACPTGKSVKWLAR